MDLSIQLADKAGPFVCAVKVHADTIDEFNEVRYTELLIY